MFINPDLPPAAAKLAYEARQQRRESRTRRLASATVVDTDTDNMDIGTNGEFNNIITTVAAAADADEAVTSEVTTVVPPSARTVSAANGILSSLNPTASQFTPDEPHVTRPAQ